MRQPSTAAHGLMNRLLEVFETRDDLCGILDKLQTKDFEKDVPPGMESLQYETPTTTSMSP